MKVVACCRSCRHRLPFSNQMIYQFCAFDFAFVNRRDFKNAAMSLFNVVTASNHLNLSNILHI